MNSNKIRQKSVARSAGPFPPALYMYLDVGTHTNIKYVVLKATVFPCVWCTVWCTMCCRLHTCCCQLHSVDHPSVSCNSCVASNSCTQQTCLMYASFQVMLFTSPLVPFLLFVLLLPFSSSSFSSSPTSSSLSSFSQLPVSEGVALSPSLHQSSGQVVPGTQDGVWVLLHVLHHSRLPDLQGHTSEWQWVCYMIMFGPKHKPWW